ncbi:unnamed protein product [Cylindrotheca closterium]|uniref:Uncharacterized protein n=1 Tax=Cylindrotheca closterium TaxID=2856 RepID=A0AAD2G2S8_9STRA|nr:unnamed protein product [Cylindrotheca closterium]
MISQIDSDARLRREDEKKNPAVNSSAGKRFDHPLPSLVNDFQQPNKRRRTSLEYSPTRVLAFDDASPSTFPFRRSNLDNNIGFRLRPRYLGNELYNESEIVLSPRKIPYMPF